MWLELESLVGRSLLGPSRSLTIPEAFVIQGTKSYNGDMKAANVTPDFQVFDSVDITIKEVQGKFQRALANEGFASKYINTGLYVLSSLKFLDTTAHAYIDWQVCWDANYCWGKLIIRSPKIFSIRSRIKQVVRSL